MLINKLLKNIIVHKLLEIQTYENSKFKYVLIRF